MTNSIPSVKRERQSTAAKRLRIRSASALTAASLALAACLLPVYADTAATESYLKQAQSFADTGRHGDARKYYELALREAYAVGQNNPKLPEVLETVADYYRTQNDFQKAEELYRRSITINESRVGRYGIEVAKVCSKLAQLYIGESKYNDAEEELRRALDIYDRKLAKERNIPNFNKRETNLLIADCLDDLARCVRQTQGPHAADVLTNKSGAIRANPTQDYF